MDRPELCGLALGAAVAALAMALPQSVDTACCVVSRFYDGLTKSGAITSSRGAFNNDLRNYKRQQSWCAITSVWARRVKLDPLWKAVRTSVSSSMILKSESCSAPSHRVLAGRRLTGRVHDGRDRFRPLRQRSAYSILAIIQLGGCDAIDV